MSKTIVINIGDQGAIITLHKGKNITKKLFVSNLTPEAIKELEKFFNKNKRAGIYILLDTIGQNYNHKTFPAVNRFDLHSLVKRKFEQEIPKRDLKGKIFIDKDKVTKKWNYLFISTPIDSPLKEWLAFVNKLQNRLYGIYLLPLEMQNFISKLLKNLQFTKNLRPKWLLVITQNKVSDLRQIATNKDSLIFTRLLSGESMKSNFGSKLKNDILRTCEYLRRFSTSFKMKDLMVVTITDKETKEKLKDVKIQNVNFVKFTPYEVAGKFDLSETVVKKDTKFFDILMGAVFLTNKKVLRFHDSKILKMNRLFLGFDALKKLVIGLSTIIAVMLAWRIYYKMDFERVKAKMEADIVSKTKILQAKKEEEFGLDEESIEEIMDIVSMSQFIKDTRKIPSDLFDKFYTVQKGIGLTYNIKWKISGFDYQKMEQKVTTNMTCEMILLNSSGNIDDLFKNFDIFSKRLSKGFSDYKLDHSRLPSNIDFNKAYYSFPIKIKIEERR